MLPGITTTNAPTLMRNRCDLLFIIDNDEAISLPSFIFHKHSIYEKLINVALADMNEFMIKIGEKYDIYQTSGDKCRRDTDDPQVTLQSQALKVSILTL